MTAKLVAVSVVTTLILIAVGVAVFFFLVLGMNGVSERRAMPVFIGYFVLAFFTLLVSAAASGWGAGRLARATQWPLWAVGPMAVLVVSAAGGGALFLGSMVLLVVLVA